MKEGIVIQQRGVQLFPALFRQWRYHGKQHGLVGVRQIAQADLKMINSQQGDGIFPLRVISVSPRAGTSVAKREVKTSTSTMDMSFYKSVRRPYAAQQPDLCRDVVWPERGSPSECRGRLA